MWDYIGTLPNNSSVGGSGTPYWQDSVGFRAILGVIDQLASQGDALAIAVRATYSDTSSSPTDALSMYGRGSFLDTIPTPNDSYSGAVAATYSGEVNSSPSDAYSLSAKASYSDASATPTDAVKAGLRLPSDTVNAPTDSRSTLSRTWIASHTTSGTAPTNPTNAYSSNNGTVATVFGGSGLSSGTSTLICTIPVGSIPSSGTKTLKIWFQISLAIGDSATVMFSNSGGVPASGVISTTSVNNLTTPTSTAITTIGSSFTVTCQHVGALLGGGGVTIDAACVEVSGL